jgi:hypothetical protein
MFFALLFYLCFLSINFLNFAAFMWIMCDWTSINRTRELFLFTFYYIKLNYLNVYFPNKKIKLRSRAAYYMYKSYYLSVLNKYVLMKIDHLNMITYGKICVVDSLVLFVCFWNPIISLTRTPLHSG